MNTTRYKPRQKKALWYRIRFGTGPAPKKRYRIRAVSSRMARERRKDRENVKEWILGKLCAAAGLRDQLGQLICRAKAHPATDRHHTRGRVGTLLHDRRFWLPLCRCSHN